MKFKTYPATVKGYDGQQAVADDAGVFEAIVSVFDNIDMVGDIVRKGAYLDTLAEWSASNNTLPVIWSHSGDPFHNIGAVIDAGELAGGDARIPSWANDWVKTHGGLYIKGQIDSGAEVANPAAAQVRHLLRKRRVTQFSFAYEVLESNPFGEDEDITELTKLWLYEVGPTPIGANPATELFTAKTQPAQPDEGQPPDPPAPPEEVITQGGQSAALFRLRAEIAAMAAGAHD